MNGSNHSNKASDEFSNGNHATERDKGVLIRAPGFRLSMPGSHFSELLAFLKMLLVIGILVAAGYGGYRLFSKSAEPPNAGGSSLTEASHLGTSTEATRK